MKSGASGPISAALHANPFPRPERSTLKCKPRSRTERAGCSPSLGSSSQEPLLSFSLNPTRMQTRSAGILLAVVLVAYTLQTELASHVQHGLGYKKPYFLFYLTHSSYLLLFPLHLAALALSRSASVPALLASLAATLEEKFQPPPLSRGRGGAGSLRKLSATTSSAAPSSPKPNQHVEHRSLFGFVDAVQKSLLVRVREPWIDYLARRVLLLTLLISAPALSWYGAVPLTSMTGKYITPSSLCYVGSSQLISLSMISKTDITAIYNVFAFVRLPTPL